MFYQCLNVLVEKRFIVLDTYGVIHKVCKLDVVVFLSDFPLYALICLLLPPLFVERRLLSPLDAKKETDQCM